MSGRLVLTHAADAYRLRVIDARGWVVAMSQSDTASGMVEILTNLDCSDVVAERMVVAANAHGIAHKDVTS